MKVHRSSDGRKYLYFLYSERPNLAHALERKVPGDAWGAMAYLEAALEANQLSLWIGTHNFSTFPAVLFEITDMDFLTDILKGLLE